jgi:hypothetical protein
MRVVALIKVKSPLKRNQMMAGVIEMGFPDLLAFARWLLKPENYNFIEEVKDVKVVL